MSFAKNISKLFDRFFGLPFCFLKMFCSQPRHLRLSVFWVLLYYSSFFGQKCVHRHNMLFIHTYWHQWRRVYVYVYIYIHPYVYIYVTAQFCTYLFVRQTSTNLTFEENGLEGLSHLGNWAVEKHRFARADLGLRERKTQVGILPATLLAFFLAGFFARNPIWEVDQLLEYGVIRCSLAR